MSRVPDEARAHNLANKIMRSCRVHDTTSAADHQLRVRVLCPCDARYADTGNLISDRVAGPEGSMGL